MIVINGVSINGNNLVIKDNEVHLDGKLIEGGEKGRIIKVEIIGDPCSVVSSASVNVDGNINGDVSCRGSINARDIGGNVVTGGSMRCHNIDGNVKVEGSLCCNNISGQIKR